MPKPKLKHKTVVRIFRNLAIKENQLDTKYREDKDGLEIARRKLRLRCPHVSVYTSWGQYMPCETICNVCGAVVKDA